MESIHEYGTDNQKQEGFVDGSIQRPTTRIKEQQQWDRCNTLVKTWLLGLMSKKIFGSVVHYKNASDMWLELQERFSHTNTVQLFNIENAIHGCVQGTGFVTGFFTRLKILWDERDALCGVPPCSCDAATKIKAYMENQKTMKFLMGLNDNYDAVRSNAVAIDPLPNAEASNGKIIAQPEAVAFTVKKGGRDLDAGKFEVRCEKCNMTNHRTKNCRAHLKCNFCGGKGQSYDYCRRRKAAMEEEQRNSRGNHVASMYDRRLDGNNFPFSQEECKELIELLNKNKATKVNHAGNVSNYDELSGKAFSTTQNGKKNVWILDSGTSDHIVYAPSLLTSLKPVHNRFVKLPDGTTAQVTHIGKDLRLEEMIGTGTEREGLYCLNPIQKGTCNSVHRQTPNLWHQRLGHLSTKVSMLFPFSTNKSCDEN
ncbi:uncharacterized protein LOC111378671 [Olea europaea var. sylvestris]|uniref:uncharacterized protein LOC111378671 n=1 Tax=Olea europaea var. sylvestris TaxID=158386 RepID=UPI000C1CDA4D|nr:uncharacterized protein LOC111378671 [Olea europaea var. sylvestris]